MPKTGPQNRRIGYLEKKINHLANLLATEIDPQHEEFLLKRLAWRRQQLSELQSGKAD